MTTVAALWEGLAAVHGACYRRIGVSADAAGKKTPRGERNNLSQQEIEADPGSGNTFSLALKHCADLYCVDFDTLDVQGCALHAALLELDTARTRTRKGSHFYVYLADVPADVAARLTGSRQQDVCAQPGFAVDLLKGNNVWETADRTVEGALRTVPWASLAPHFRLEAAAPPAKRMRGEGGAARPAAASAGARLPDDVAEFMRAEGIPVTNVYTVGSTLCAHVDITCPFAGRKHTSNHCYVVVGPHALQLRCHDEQCAGKGHILSYTAPRGASAGAGAAEPVAASEDVPMQDADDDAAPVEEGGAGASEAGDGAIQPRERFEDHYDAADPSAMVGVINKYVAFIDGCKGGKSVYVVEEPGYPPVLKSRQTLLEYFEDEVFNLPVQGARGAVRVEKVCPISLWLRSPARRKHREVGFNPRAVGHTRRVFNNWQGFAVTAEAAAAWAAENDWEEAVQPFVEHIRRIWCKGNDEHADYVCKWYAHIMQRPWEKTRVSLSVKSRLEGAGKSIIDESVGAIIGNEYYVELSDESQVTGQFTSILANKLLVVMDEAVFGGDKKSHGKLLSTITGAKQKIECKGVDAIFVDSFINLRSNSNKEHMAYVQDGSRRPFMLEASNEMGSVMTAATSAYFQRLAAVPKEALAHFLYTLNLDGVNIRSFPQTALYRDQILRSLPAFRSFWHTVFSRGYVAPARTEGNGVHAVDIAAIDWEPDGAAAAGQHRTLPLHVAKEEVYAAFRAETRGQSYVDTSSVFWQNSLRLFDDTAFFDDKRVQTDGRRVRGIILPPLERCIALWNEASSVKIE